MNAKMYTTAAAAAPDFPTPCGVQRPHDNLRDTLAFFSPIDCHLDDGSMTGNRKEYVPNTAVASIMTLDNDRAALCDMVSIAAVDEEKSRLATQKNPPSRRERFGLGETEACASIQEAGSRRAGAL